VALCFSNRLFSTAGFEFGFDCRLLEFLESFSAAVV
jgi:hypothetical protein